MAVTGRGDPQTCWNLGSFTRIVRDPSLGIGVPTVADPLTSDTGIQIILTGILRLCLVDNQN